MQKIYLDTNIFIIGFGIKRSNSARILEEINMELIEVTLSDYLFDEIFSYYRSKGRRNEISLIRKYLTTVPYSKMIFKEEWSRYISDYQDHIKDVDDIPHICSYFANNCEIFVTTNRRLTQMIIGDIVCFMSPKEFLSYLGKKTMKTENDI
jgi:predicted nucleic acid-binding protein